MKEPTIILILGQVMFSKTKIYAPPLGHNLSQFLALHLVKHKITVRIIKISEDERDNEENNFLFIHNIGNQVTLLSIPIDFCSNIY